MIFFEYENEFKNYKGEDLGIFIDFKNQTLFVKNSENLNTYKLIKPCGKIENETLENLQKLLSDIDDNIIDIVYGYIHKEKFLTSSGYAYKRHISEPTLFRYINKVKKRYLNFNNESF